MILPLYNLSKKWYNIYVKIKKGKVRLDRMEKEIINALQEHVRVVDGNGVQKVEFYTEYGVKMVLDRKVLTEEQWNAFKTMFRNF